MQLESPLNYFFLLPSSDAYIILLVYELFYLAASASRCFL